MGRRVHSMAGVGDRAPHVQQPAWLVDLDTGTARPCARYGAARTACRLNMGAGRTRWHVATSAAELQRLLERARGVQL